MSDFKSQSVLIIKHDCSSKEIHNITSKTCDFAMEVLEQISNNKGFKID